MSNPSGVSIADECILAVNKLRSGRGPNKPKFIIYKVSEDQKSVVVEEISAEQDYEVFRQKLASAADDKGNTAPRYAVYDVEYDLGDEGKRTKTVFISWIPDTTPVKLRMIYASTLEQLKRALNLSASIHADNLDEIEWDTILREVSGGKVSK